MDTARPEQIVPAPHRTASLTRRTRETVVDIYLDIDGTGNSQVSTRFAFLDHCLETLALHGAFDLRLKVDSPRPDLHHCAEDAGWAFGTALRRCLGTYNAGMEPECGVGKPGHGHDMDLRCRATGEAGYSCTGEPDSNHEGAAMSLVYAPVRRFGWATIPFDEVLVLVSLDLIGRPGFYLTPDDGLEHSDLQEFFRAFGGGAGATLHVQVLRNGNLHHKVECCFKGLGRALRDAVVPDLRVKQASVKGSVEYRTEGTPHES
ncbi:MAG TPA: hypothetical protein GX510_01995 [Firmicutes bacterium]|nr:hypothetical protein [Candidatus Fermentithermobacillaceae bacterium]